MQQYMATTRKPEPKVIRNREPIGAPELTCGLDVSDRYTHVCVLDSAGEVIHEQRIRTTALALQGAFAGSERARVVLEAGPRSPWMSRLLAECGHQVIVANPRQIALIGRSHRKTDRTDAEQLARLGRVDQQLLAPIRHRSAQSQQHLAVVRSRNILVHSRTRLINHVRGAVRAWGASLPQCTAPTFHRKVADIPVGEGHLLPLLVQHRLGLRWIRA